MGKGLRDIFMEELGKVKLSESLIRRLVPPRGHGWDRMFHSLILIFRDFAHRIRVDIKNGASVHPGVVSTAMELWLADDDLPYSDNSLTDLTADEDSDTGRIKAKKKVFTKKRPSSGASTSSQSAQKTPRVSKPVPRKKSSAKKSSAKKKKYSLRSTRYRDLDFGDDGPPPPPTGGCGIVVS